MWTLPSSKILIFINAWQSCKSMVTRLRLSDKSPECNSSFGKRISLRFGLPDHERRSRTAYGEVAGVGYVFSFRTDSTRAARNQPNPHTYECIAHRQRRHC